MRSGVFHAQPVRHYTPHRGTHRERDMERLLETNASAIAFTGLALGLTDSKKWLIVPGIVLPFLFQHAVQGWCPPVPVFRRLGVRTREEIDRERYALKVLRGDFEKVNRYREPMPHWKQWKLRYTRALNFLAALRRCGRCQRWLANLGPVHRVCHLT